MLYIVSEPCQLAKVARYVQSNDDVLLIENAVYATALTSPYYEILNQLPQAFVLYNDLAARAWLNRCDENIEMIDEMGWVDLIARHRASMRWS